MKKLGKLIISPEKVMRNEELINLQGGYFGGCNWYYCECQLQHPPVQWNGYYCSQESIDNAINTYCDYPEHSPCAMH